MAMSSVSDSNLDWYGYIRLARAIRPNTVCYWITPRMSAVLDSLAEREQGESSLDPLSLKFLKIEAVKKLSISE